MFFDLYKIHLRSFLQFIMCITVVLHHNLTDAMPRPGMDGTSQLSNTIPSKLLSTPLNARQAERSLAVIGKVIIDRSVTTVFYRMLMMHNPPLPHH